MVQSLTKRFTSEQISQMKEFYDQFKEHKWNSESRQAALRELISTYDLTEKQVYTFCKNKKSRDKKKEIKNEMRESNIRIPQTAKQCASALSQQMRELFSQMNSEVTSSKKGITEKDEFFDTFFQTVKRPKIDESQQVSEESLELMSADSNENPREGALSSSASTADRGDFGIVTDRQSPFSFGVSSLASSTLSSPKVEACTTPTTTTTPVSLPKLRVIDEPKNDLQQIPPLVLNPGESMETSALLVTDHYMSSVKTSNLRLEMEARKILSSINAGSDTLFNPLTDHQSRRLPLPKDVVFQTCSESD